MPRPALCSPLRAAWPLRWPDPYRSARPYRWAMWSCLLLLSACCATQPVTTAAIPANLDRPCPRGPALPDADVPLADLLRIIAAREAAARECAARVHGLRGAWPR